MNVQPFKSAWWLPGPHLQTLWPALFRWKPKFNMRKERLELADGDFLDLVWVGKNTGPLVILLHGLNGNLASPYINGMLRTIEKNGWRGVLMHFRGCGGEANRLTRSYHSGETGDLKILIAELIKRQANVELYVVGYSLGGNVLLKALGEATLPTNLKAAVAVSIPFELDKTATHLNKGFAKIYQSRLVNDLIDAYKDKYKNRPSPLKNIDFSEIKTFLQFDDAVTAPLHGFANAADYYKKSSSRQYLGNIQIPTLIIHAYNDPFTDPASLPNANEVSATTTLEITDQGGHVGFTSGKLPWVPIYWLELRIMNYLNNNHVGLRST